MLRKKRRRPSDTSQSSPADKTAQHQIRPYLRLQLPSPQGICQHNHRAHDRSPKLRPQTLLPVPIKRRHVAKEQRLTLLSNHQDHLHNSRSRIHRRSTHQRLLLRRPRDAERADRSQESRLEQKNQGLHDALPRRPLKIFPTFRWSVQQQLRVFLEADARVLGGESVSFHGRSLPLLRL